MKSIKNKRVVLNIVSNIMYEIIVLFFGLVLPRLYLLNFGSDVNGLDSTIKNIFAYLALLEAGVGLSAQYALYGPVAKNDRDRINEILSATKRFYLRSGVLYTVLTVAFAVVYPLIIKTTLDYFTVFMIVILYGTPGVILFLLRGKYTAFLEVEGKQFVLTTLSTVTFIISNVLRLLLLLFTSNLILIQATYCIPSIIQIVFVVIYVKKRYSWINWNATPDMKALSQKKSVLIHQICGCVFSNTDAIIISVMSGMNYVSVYAVYSLFYRNIQKIITSFTKGITFKFGQTYQNDNGNFNKDFSLYETIYYLLLFIIYAVVTAFLLPVIRLYTSGLSDSAIYDSTVLLILFSLSFLMTAIEDPQHQLIYVSGSFEATQNQAFWEMAINIVVSVAATYKFGLIGCLIGTIAALAYRINALFLFTSKKIRKISCLTVYKKVAVNFIVYIITVLFMLKKQCAAKSYIYVVGKAAVNALWIVPVFIAVNVLSNIKEFKMLFNQIKTAIKRK